MGERAVNVPEGFAPLSRTSPALDLIGPVYAKGQGADFMLGLRVQNKHCNGRHVMHGGMLATLMDAALGYATAFLSDPPTPLLTANLTLDFAGAARAGDWVEVSVDIQKRGARLAFANGFASVAGERIVRASGVFLVTGTTEVTSGA
jgi:acyl-coenzyme A thioesterase 13